LGVITYDFREDENGNRPPDPDDLYAEKARAAAAAVDAEAEAAAREPLPEPQPTGNVPQSGYVMVRAPRPIPKHGPGSGTMTTKNPSLEFGSTLLSLNNGKISVVAPDDLPGVMAAPVSNDHEPFTRGDVIEAVGPDTVDEMEPEEIAAVLNNIVRCGNLRRAVTPYRTSCAFRSIRKKYPALDELAMAAHEMYQDKVRQTLHVLALEGTIEPVFHKGELVGGVRRFYPDLLKMEVRRHCAEYREADPGENATAAGVLLVALPGSESDDEWETRTRKIKRVENEADTEPEHGHDPG
jgi:hypothetical protein